MIDFKKYEKYYKPELSIAQKLAQLPKQEYLNFLSKLSAKEQKALKYDWKFWGRPKQLFPILNNDWEILYLNCGRFFGKALGALTPIFTVNKGWVKWFELEVGDTLLTETGGTTKITKVHDPYIAEKCYRITFSDGTQIECTDDHRWATLTRKDRMEYSRTRGVDKNKYPKDWIRWSKIPRQGNIISKEKFALLHKLKSEGKSVWEITKEINLNRKSQEKYLSMKSYPEFSSFDEIPIGRIKTTSELVETFWANEEENRENHSIPNCSPIEFEEKPLPIEPYLYGIWLGDGNSWNGSIACHKSDYDQLAKNITAKGFKVSKFQGYDKKYPNSGILNIYGFAKILKENNLFRNKHIIKDYLYGSINQRLELLQGLMDTDGTASKQGCSVSFYNTNKDIVDAVKWLVTSLGMKGKLTSNRNYHNGKEGKLLYRFEFSATVPVFKFKRKLDRIRFDTRTFIERTQRTIVNIEEIEPCLMNCISVDSKNESYLVTESLICGINTKTGAETVRYWAENNPKANIALVSPTTSATRDIMVLDGLEKVCPPNTMVYQRSKSRIVWKNGAQAILLSADAPDRIRGHNFTHAWVDEISSFRKMESWDVLLFALRKSKNPKALITSTPKVNELTLKVVEMIESDPEHYKLLSGSTYENIAYAPEFYLRLVEQYEGTPYGDQEIHAKIIKEVAGALWKPSWFKWLKTTDPETGAYILGSEPEYERTVIAVDIAVTANQNSDFTTICVASKATNGDFYIREIIGLKCSPKEWAEQIIAMFYKYNADLIVVETNQGGDTIRQVISDRKSYPDQNGRTHKCDGSLLPIKDIKAHEGKRLRAEPVSALYQIGRVWHVDNFAELQSQMVVFTGKDGRKDDYVDAAVYAILELAHGQMNQFFAPKVGGVRTASTLKFL